MSGEKHFHYFFTLPLSFLVILINKQLEEQKKIDFDPGKGWARFSKRIEEEQQQQLIIRMKRINRLKYAAVLFIPVALAALFFLSNPEKSQNTAANCFSSIKAGTGEMKKISLPDGSLVWLNAASELRYSCSFQGKAERVVSLIRGEAYFEVKHDEKQAFVVEVNKMKVKVYGTSFNVNSYQANVKTTLLTGSIGATAGKESLMLKPGQQAIFNPSKNSFAVKTVNAAEDALWRTGTINFDNTSLKEIAEVIERQYGYKFHFQSAIQQDLRFTTQLKLSDGLPTLLNNLSKVSGLAFKLRNKTVFLNN